MRGEEAITRKLARLLRASGWRILSTHHPGAQGGVYVLRTPRPKPATKGAVVLDLVAEHRGRYLLVESKDRYYHADALKVLRAATDRCYRDSLAERFGIDWAAKPVVIPSLAVPQSEAVPGSAPKGILVIAVGAGINAAAGCELARGLPGLHDA